MEREFNEKKRVSVKELGIMFNVHSFVIYSYLRYSRIDYTIDKYGRGSVDGAEITRKFEGLKAFVKGLRNGRKDQAPLKEIAFIDKKVATHKDWESKADGLDKVKKVFHASQTGDIYRINHYPDMKRSLYRWDKATKAWRLVESEKTARNADGWMKDITDRYRLCNPKHEVSNATLVLDTI